MSHEMTISDVSKSDSYIPTFSLVFKANVPYKQTFEHGLHVQIYFFSTPIDLLKRAMRSSYSMYYESHGLLEPQRPRIDLNKRFLQRPNTTTAYVEANTP